VVLLKLPTLALPRPRLLDTYVSKIYLRIVGLAFFGLLGLYYIGQFIDLSEKLLKGSATGGMMLSFLWYSTPQFISYIMPIAILIAVLGTVGGLTRTGELTVMRACGVSIYRVAAPLVLLALVWSGGLFLLEEHVLARANRKAEVLEDVIRDRAPRTVNVANKNWLVAEEDGRIYYWAVFDPSTSQIIALSVFDPATPPYRLNSHTYVSRASHGPNGWHAETGWTQHFDGDESRREDFEDVPIRLAPLEDFERGQVDTRLMTFGEQRRYIQQLEASGYSVAKQEVELQQKLAFPLVTVVMTLLAVPFGLTTGRRGALYGVGLAIVLTFGYAILTTFFMAAGAAGMLPAVLAAWATNILYLTGALYLLLTVRT
jgi:LPS export ABC transporter permease LptG